MLLPGLICDTQTKNILQWLSYTAQVVGPEGNDFCACVYYLCGGTWHLTQAIRVRFLFLPAQTRRLSPLTACVGTLFLLSHPVPSNTIHFSLVPHLKGEKQSTKEQGKVQIPIMMMYQHTLCKQLSKTMWLPHIIDPPITYLHFCWSSAPYFDHNILVERSESEILYWSPSGNFACIAPRKYRQLKINGLIHIVRIKYCT